jgi:hypothetical protein
LKITELPEIPEVVAIDADEAYHDSLEGRTWTESLDVRVAAEIEARHTAYAKVWQAGREPLTALLDACRERLTRCAAHHGLASAASRDIRRLVAAIEEELPAISPAETDTKEGATTR